MEHHSPKRLDINTYKILNIPTLYSKHPQKIRVCILYLTSENLLAQCIVLQQFWKAFLWYLNLKPMVNKYGGKYLVIPLRYNYSTQWLQHYRMSVNFHHNEHVYDKWQRIINYRTLFTNILMALYFFTAWFHSDVLFFINKGMNSSRTRIFQLLQLIQEYLFLDHFIKLQNSHSSKPI